MNAKFLLVLCLLLLVSNLANAKFMQVEIKASDNSHIHNLDTGLNYTSIQEAIDANETLNGQTILVDDGTYYEHIAVNKSLTLVGEDRDNTIVNGSGTGPVFALTAHNVSLVNFTATNAGPIGEYSGYPDSPPGEDILLNGTSGCLIENVETSNCNIGVFLNYSSDNEILRCVSVGVPSFGGHASQIGIFLALSDENIVSGSVSSGNGIGIHVVGKNNSMVGDEAFSNLNGLDIVGNGNSIISCQAWDNGQAGIVLDSVNDATVKDNVILNNTSSFGVFLVDGSANNTFCENIIENNLCGISGLNDEGGDSGSDNLFYDNNIVGNGLQVMMPIDSLNIWDDGYPSGGNYWSDYKGTDIFSGIYQNESGSDGIGDKPYNIAGYNVTDRYPLAGMFSSFNATSHCEVQTISNSTISDFQFNSTAASFDVGGENGTVGFCRICIQKALISGVYRIFVNGTEVPYTLLPGSGNIQSYLYFTYHSSTQHVIVIPEFPFLLILSLYSIAVLFSALVFKKKRICSFHITRISILEFYLPENQKR